MELCDPTNNIMFKSILENNNKQPRAIHYKGDMYVHVTDEKMLWKMKLDTCINLYALMIVKVQ